MRSKFLHFLTHTEMYVSKSQSLLNEVKVSTRRCHGVWNGIKVAIPFKWGQSFYLPGDWIASILPTPSQSLLNEVKVSTAEDGGVTLQRFVAIPFKWGQSFYQWCGNNRPRTNLSQSLLNEVKVSTKIMSRPECQKCVAIPFKWGQSFYTLWQQNG